MEKGHRRTPGEPANAPASHVLALSAKLCTLDTVSKGCVTGFCILCSIGSLLEELLALRLQLDTKHELFDVHTSVKASIATWAAARYLMQDSVPSIVQHKNAWPKGCQQT